MVCFHLFIISTFPLAVPLEWNVLFAYAAVFLFLGFPNWHGYAVCDMSLAVAGACCIVAALCFFPVLGNLRPDLVSFLPVDAAVRRQLGVGAVGVRPGRRGEARTASPGRRATQVDQLDRLRLRTAGRRDVAMQQTLGWRSMHSQGRGLFSVLLKNLPDIDTGPCAKASSSATRWSASTSATATCTTRT